MKAFRTLRAAARPISTADFMNPKKPLAPKFHRFAAKALGATMWFWIFYRIREDGPEMFGMEHPWEEDDHHHAEE